MKYKRLILLVAVLLALVATPAPAYAWTGVAGQVRDTTTNDLWSWGGTVYLIHNGLLVGQDDLNNGPGLNGSFEILYPGPIPDLDTLTAYIVTTPGPSGSPGVLVANYDEVAAIPTLYQLPTIQTGNGPNAIELVDFSVTHSSSSNAWLPFILLVGSVALVSGAVTLIRKSRV